MFATGFYPIGTNDVAGRMIRPMGTFNISNDRLLNAMTARIGDLETENIKLRVACESLLEENVALRERLTSRQEIQE